MTEPHAPALTTEALQQRLSDWFAPWVQALGLRGEPLSAGEGSLRLPQNDQLSRVGGMLRGQAMMSAAATAMVLAIVAQLGDQRPMATVQQNTSFLKPLSGQDARATARVIRAGKSLVLDRK